MASRFLAGLHPGWFVPEPLGAGPVHVVPLSRAGSLQLAYEQRALLVLLALPVAGHSAGLVDGQGRGHNQEQEGGAGTEGQP